MPSTLVTGGAGFIGCNLCRALLKKGHEVVCFDNLSTGSRDNIAGLEDKKSFSFVKGDANKRDIERVFEKNSFDYVFHHAAVVGVRKTEENPLAVLNDVEGIKKVLELSRRHDVKKAVFASSSEVYGQPAELPEREDGLLNPKIPYAVVKLMGEKLFEAYYKGYGLKTTSLRLFNVYGPYQNSTAYGFVVGIFIRQALSNQDLTVFGDGKQSRDFVFVEDNVNATLRALESDKVNGKVINIGSGKETTINELADKIIRITGKEGRLKKIFLPPRKGEILRRCPDVTKKNELLGYEIKNSLEDGLKKTIGFYSENV